MTPAFRSKLKLLNLELLILLDDGTPEQIIPVVDRIIEHVEPNIGPFDPHAYFVLLEKMKDLREACLPAVEDIQAIYSRDTKRD